MNNLTTDSNFKVSIITVVKNGEKTIDALFDSVRKFKTDDVEFIVIDGLSDDKTVELIKQNQDIVNTWKSESDNGIYDAMNKAVKLAKGRWVIFIGADDELLAGFKEIIPALVDKNAIYYGKVFFHNTY